MKGRSCMHVPGRESGGPFALFAILLTATPAMAEPFSIRCDRGAYYFQTFDTATNRMISETIGGSTFRGRIKAVSENEIQFVLLLGGQTPPDLYLMRREGRVDVQKDSERSVTLEHCVPAPTRDILGSWDRWD
jgi:hypothetical protein